MPITQDMLNMNRGLKRHIHEQTTPSTDWTVVHNLNSLSTVNDVVVTYHITPEKVLPLSVDVVDANTISVKWTNAHTGMVRVS